MKCRHSHTGQAVASWDAVMLETAHYKWYIERLPLIRGTSQGFCDQCARLAHQIAPHSANKGAQLRISRSQRRRDNQPKASRVDTDIAPSRLTATPKLHSISIFHHNLLIIYMGAFILRNFQFILLSHVNNFIGTNERIVKIYRFSQYAIPIFLSPRVCKRLITKLKTNRFVCFFIVSLAVCLCSRDLAQRRSENHMQIHMIELGVEAHVVEPQLYEVGSWMLLTRKTLAHHALWFLDSCTWTFFFPLFLFTLHSKCHIQMVYSFQFVLAISALQQFLLHKFNWADWIFIFAWHEIPADVTVHHHNKRSTLLQVSCT